MNVFTAYAISVASFVTGGVYLVCHGHPVFGALAFIGAFCSAASLERKQ